jgi:hypothetical protein
MRGSDLPEGFIVLAKTVAKTDQGVFDLMSMWFYEEDKVEREAIVKDITEMCQLY